MLNAIDEPGAATFAQLQGITEPAFPTAYACAAAYWQIESASALIAYLWSWILLAGEALAHPGHGALVQHFHGWEYALLVAVLAAAGWMTRRK